MKARERLLSVGMPVAAILLALLIGSVLIVLGGESPIRVYAIMLKGAVGDWRSLTDTLLKTVPLSLAALAFAFAAKCSVWNIGAEGQLYMGALASVAAGIYLQGLPRAIHLPLALIVGALAGGLWAGIAAFLKIKLKINEVVNTIMMNYIAIRIASALVYGPMIEHFGKSPQTKAVLETAELSVMFPGTKLHTGFLIAIGAIVFYAIVFRYTKFGHRLTAVGFNEEASRVNGISITKSIFFGMFISGIFAGLAGATEMLGTNHRLIIGFSPEYGSDGIAIALLGQLHPVGIFLSSFLFGALRMGSTAMQRQTEVPMQLVSVIQGIIVLFVIAGSALRIVLANRIRKKEVM